MKCNCWMNCQVSTPPSAHPHDLILKLTCSDLRREYCNVAHVSFSLHIASRPYELNDCLMARFLADPKSENTIKVPLALTVYSAVVTWSYLIINNPVFHQISYAILVIGVVIRAIKLFNTVPKSYTYEVPRMQCLLWMSALGFIVAFILWNIDNQFCSSLRSWRSTVPFLIGATSEVKEEASELPFYIVLTVYL